MRKSGEWRSPHSPHYTTAHDSRQSSLIAECSQGEQEEDDSYWIMMDESSRKLGPRAMTSSVTFAQCEGREEPKEVDDHDECVNRKTFTS